MAYPKVDRSTRLAVVAGAGGTTMYGNRAAFRTLARWMSWLARSDPREHYELHIPWHLQSPLTRSKRVRVLKRVRGGTVRALKEFEVTFMTVESRDLEALTKKTRPSSARRTRTR
jgi:hypothetical protein